jgi:hypothetical protein
MMNSPGIYRHSEVSEAILAQLKLLLQLFFVCLYFDSLTTYQEVDMKSPRWLVSVFRPNGWLLCKLECAGRDALAAKESAKKKIYRQGRLAHFYTYVPVDRKIQ